VKIDVDSIIKLFNENPIAALAVGAAFLTGLGKFIDSVSAAQGRKAYAKQVNHRIKKNRR
jgi:hypothetical protein